MKFFSALVILAFSGVACFADNVEGVSVYDGKYFRISNNPQCYETVWLQTNKVDGSARVYNISGNSLTEISKFYKLNGGEKRITTHDGGWGTGTTVYYSSNVYFTANGYDLRAFWRQRGSSQKGLAFQIQVVDSKLTVFGYENCEYLKN